MGGRKQFHTEQGIESHRHSVERLVARGLTVIVAAGNDQEDACAYTPGHLKEVITVGATGFSDKRASISNFGRCIDVWAPGVDIISLGIASADSTSTQTGTSMACPHVSGAAALLLEANASLTPAEVRASIQAAALRGHVGGLTKADVNSFLWAGPTLLASALSGPVAHDAEVTCPASARTHHPDEHGNCRCLSGTHCMEGMGLGCRGFDGQSGDSDFIATCSTCRCRARRFSDNFVKPAASIVFLKYDLSCMGFIYVNELKDALGEVMTLTNTRRNSNQVQAIVNEFRSQNQNRAVLKREFVGAVLTLRDRH